MCEFNVDSSSVEDFLAAERKKLDEDRKIVDLILKLLNDEQQIYSNLKNDESTQTEFDNRNAGKKVVDTENSKEQVIHFQSSKASKTYNSQIEKERLAYLFENAPNFLNLRLTPKKHRHKENYKFNSANKENQAPVCLCRSNLKTSSLKTWSYETNQTETNNVKSMVQVGEFSPLKSSFDSFDRSLMGLGEFEGRRRAFLEKKKREYMEYLSNMKANRKLQRLRGEKSASEANKGDGYVSLSGENSPSRERSQLHQKIFTRDGSLIKDVDLNHCYTRIQQENYRKELDEQIKEKDKLEQERKNSEEKECQRNQCNDMKKRREVMIRIEDDFNKRLQVLNDCKRKSEHNRENEPILPHQNRIEAQLGEEKLHGPKFPQPNEPFVKQNIETCSIENMNTYDKMKKELYKKELIKQMEEKQQREEQLRSSAKLKERYSRNGPTNSRVPHYLGNPFMKQSAESCAIGDLEEYRRMKDEIYKKELDKQIEEKRKLEAERKAKAEEADRKLEEKLRKDEERRLTEVQKNEVFLKRVEENNCQATNSHVNKSDIASKNHQSDSSSKGSSVASTDLKSKERIMGKNVTFAPQAYIYGQRENSPLVRSDKKTFNDGSVIIEAPYVLAVKNISNSSNIDNDHNHKKSVSPKSPERLPVPPNVRQSLPGIADLPIPSTVSMSEQAVRDYFKTSAFSDLSRIRKMLRERESKNL